MKEISHFHPAEQIHSVLCRIYAKGMTTTSGGNLSIMQPNGDLWITPSRVDKGSLTVEDIVCVQADGSIDGKHKPSSEYAFHKVIYNARPDLKAVVHAHLPAFASFCITKKVPDTRVFPKAYEICGEIGYSDYELPGSEKLAYSIAKEFEKGMDCILMENHGIVIGGNSLSEAFYKLETLEFCSRIILQSNLLGETHYLDQASMEREVDQQFFTEVGVFHDPDTHEYKLRKELCKFARRGCEQDLFISTEGSLSVRLKGNRFLITPTGCDRYELEPEDIVYVEDLKVATGKKPSHATIMHDAIYRKHPHVNSIINAYPIHASAFGLTRKDIDTTVIPESYLFLREIKRTPFIKSREELESMVTLFNTDTFLCMIENDSLVSTGASLLDAFDKLEVAESTARALIYAKMLGPVTAMSNQKLEELEEAFLR
jgi:L-fuculose-phosphate aldolase